MLVGMEELNYISSVFIGDTQSHQQYRRKRGLDCISGVYSLLLWY